MTLRSATARFLTQLEADGKSPLTISVYRRELDRFGRWLGATTDGPLARAPGSGLAVLSPFALTETTRKLSAGVYFAKLEFGGRFESRKIVLVKISGVASPEPGGSGLALSSSSRRDARAYSES